MNDLIGFSLLVSVLILCIVALYYGSAYERSLRAMKDTKEDEYYLKLRESREKRLDSDIKATQWLSDRIMHPVLAVRRVFEHQKAVELSTLDGYRVVITPLKPASMRSILKELKPRKVAKGLIEPILPLGLGWARTRKFSKGLEDDVYFDLDAAVVGKELGVNWDFQNKLWVYIRQEQGKKEDN
ncbi:MAG: hypothetical protein JEZ06_08860 [Anaerolineaceae bacterium]|nr:hypothetical protein [Anaerolineaceae bacterium]